MAQVRILFKDGTRDDIDIDNERTASASVRDDRVVVVGQHPNADSITELGSYPVADVEAVVTTLWTSTDAE